VLALLEEALGAGRDEASEASLDALREALGLFVTVAEGDEAMASE
jgi:hypothetical protein